MVSQPIGMHASALECYVMSETQIIDLPFKCIESDLYPKLEKIGAPQGLKTI
jgi:hypothetical protein